MYQVVIVEDDPMISMLNARFTEKDGRFHVIRTFEAGNAAWEYLRIHAVDLVILDVYMPQMSGLELLHRMRAAGVSAEVIMITAANDSETVESLLRLGVADFLVKPFSYERFRQALDNFCRRKEALRGGSVNQQNLDRLFVDAADPIAALNLPAPKGMQAKTLEHILEFLSQTDEQYTCEQISEHVGLSTVTVRRYVNYLVEIGRVQSEINYGTGGRPSIVYRRM